MFRFGRAENSRTIEEPVIEHGYLYMQKWNHFTRTPDPKGFLSEQECRGRWHQHQDDQMDWFTVVPAEPSVGTFMRRDDGGFEIDPASAVPSWTMEVTPRGGIAIDGPAFQVFVWDANNRNVTLATYSNRWGGRLFLSEVIYKIFPEPDDFRPKERALANKPLFSNQLHLSPNGEGQRTRIDHSKHTKDVEQFHGVDVEPNWANTPDFGDWEALPKKVLEGNPLI